MKKIYYSCDIGTRKVDGEEKEPWQVEIRSTLWCYFKIKCLSSLFHWDLSCFHTQDGQWSRKKSRKVIFIISTITIDLQSHGHENDKQFSPGPTPGREHQHTFNKTSNSISSMIWISPTVMARWSMQRHRKYQVLSWQMLSSNKVTTHRSRCWCLYSIPSTD